MTTKFATFFILCFLLCLGACSKVPGNLLSEKQMRAVLLDMQLASSVISIDYQSHENAEKKEAIYRSIFKKHNISEALYDSSLLWYGRNLDIYMRVYENVIKDLKNKKVALGDYKSDLIPIIERDSIELWELPTVFELRDNLLDNRLAFDISPEEYESFLSGTKFVLGMNVWGVPSDSLYYPTLKVRIEHQDTILKFEQKIRHDGWFESSFQSDSLKRVNRISGSIVMNADVLYQPIDTLSLPDTIMQPDGQIINLDSLLDVDHGYRVYLDSISLMRYHLQKEKKGTDKK
jgi:hypothetical protein